MDDKPIPAWLETEMLHGIGLLIRAGLRFPPNDATATGQEWCRLMMDGRVWDVHQDTPRIRRAFRDLAQYHDQFPTLRQLLHEIEINKREGQLALEHDRNPIPPERLKELYRGLRERLQVNRRQK
jgi:hypothetical protein